MSICSSVDPYVGKVRYQDNAQSMVLLPPSSSCSSYRTPLSRHLQYISSSTAIILHVFSPLPYRLSHGRVTITCRWSRITSSSSHHHLYLVECRGVKKRWDCLLHGQFFYSVCSSSFFPSLIGIRVKWQLFYLVMLLESSQRVLNSNLTGGKRLH